MQRIILHRRVMAREIRQASPSTKSQATQNLQEILMRVTFNKHTVGDEPVEIDSVYGKILFTPTETGIQTSFIGDNPPTVGEIATEKHSLILQALISNAFLHRARAIAQKRQYN